MPNIERMNKQQERFYVDEAAQILNVQWQILEERESPDFLVADGSKRFGLEITEVFKGPVSRKGAVLKEAESLNQRTIDTFRRLHAQNGGPPLRIQILGKVDDQTMTSFVAELAAHDITSMSITEQITVKTAHLKALVTKALRADWHSVDDRIGFVNQNALPVIQQAVADKAAMLQKYTNAVGEDVRLLLVARRTRASGMLDVNQDSTLDLYGFRTVYFFAYPESVKSFH